MVCRYWTFLFPNLVSYERFNAMTNVMIIMMFYLKQQALSCSRGINYIDSTTIKACHIKREKQHKVLKGFAT